MDDSTRTRPMRSALYVPGSKPRAIDKARGIDADAVIFDLEDAVAPDAKPAARDAVAAALGRGGYGRRLRVVRVNGLDTQWGADDLRVLANADCDAVLVPKAGAPHDIDAAASRLPDGRCLWAMIETARGVVAAASIAAHPRVAALVVGTNDLAADLGCRSDRAALTTALQTCVLAARAAGVPILDGVFNAFGDAAGLAAECRQGRDWGFDGKTVIHPDQIAAANAAFAPTPDEIDLARRQIAAHEDAKADGQGVAVLDGRIVEALHVDTARRTLARWASIEAMENTP